MTSTTEEPAQAQRLEAVAGTGPSATKQENANQEQAQSLVAEKAANGASEESSNYKGGMEKPMEKPQAPKMSKGKIALIMLSLMIAVFLAALDTTIVTTAIPTITERFKASEAEYSWIGSAYLLGGAAATPTWGKLSDIWGRKPIILVANTLFFVGSLIAALSININMLLAGRVIQGIGGGGLISLANICISDLFSMRDRGKYFGMIGGVWGIASAIGPVLGGVFTEKVSWRWCFYINLPFDGIAFIIILFFLDIETSKTPMIAGLKAIDWIGVITTTGATIMFLLGLQYGGVTFPWNSATVVCLILFGVLTMVLFLINEWKIAKYPMMPLSLFKQRSNLASLGVCLVHGVVFMGGAYFLPLYFQAVLGTSPILSGVYILPFVLSLSLMSVAVGIFIKKTGQYLPPIYLGVSVMALGFGLFIDLPNGRTWGRIFPFQIIAGIGVGPLFQAPLIALQTLVPPRDIATATATYGFTRQISTSISVVIGGVIFQNEMKKRGDLIRNAVGPAVGDRLAGGGAGSATMIVQKLEQPARHIITGAYTSSLKTMWIFYCAFAALGLVSAAFIGKKKLSKEHEVYKAGLEEEEKHRKERIAEKAAKRESKRQSKTSRQSLESGRGSSMDQSRRQSLEGEKNPAGGLKYNEMAALAEMKTAEEKAAGNDLNV